MLTFFGKMKKMILRYEKFTFSFQIPGAEATADTTLLSRCNSSLMELIMTLQAKDTVIQRKNAV
jgi:hypothetical protein